MSKPRKVLAFFPVIQSGGLEVASSRILNALVQRGWEVSLFFLRCDDGTDVLFSPQIRRVRIKAIPLPIGANPKMRDGLAVIPWLIHRLAVDRPDVILSFQSTTACLVAASLFGVPVVHRECLDISQAMAGQPFQRALVVAGKRFAYRLCAGIVTNSAGSRNSLVRVTGMSSKRITLIYNPVDPDILRAFSTKALPSGPVEKTFFMGVPVFVAVGRLSAEKDVGTLLYAFAALVSRQDARLVLVGEGKLRHSLQDLARALDIADRVVFAGHLSNPHAVLARCTAYVLSSRYEGLPNALLEAVALGIPAISTDCPSGPREILLGGNAGLLVPVGDVDALAAAMAEVLNDPHGAALRVKAAHEGLTRFSPSAVAQQYDEVLQAAVWGERI